MMEILIFVFTFVLFFFSALALVMYYFAKAVFYDGICGECGKWAETNPDTDNCADCDRLISSKPKPAA